jgi:hypothetical protein
MDNHMAGRQNQICIIIPYFGHWPAWIEYFFASCIYNKTIDWLFFTDCKIPTIQAPNLFFIDFSLKEFNSLVRTKLNLNTEINNAYKLCDFKPAYGMLFSEQIRDYEFWGYGDLDLIYGNISEFLSPVLLKDFDIISNHNNFITGHFCILRNTPKIIHLFKTGNTFKKIFTRNAYFGFDENIKRIPLNTSPILIQLTKKLAIYYDLIFSKLMNVQIIRTIFKKIQPDSGSKWETDKDFTSIVFNSAKNHKIRVHLNKTYQCEISLAKDRIKKWEIIWNEGTLIDMTNHLEILYFHFQLSKNRKKFTIENMKENVGSFAISPEGIKWVKK